MNMFNSNGGFTLVELIVVIVILGILAGLTVPAYGGYIEKAKSVQATVDARAASIDALANGYLNENGMVGDLNSVNTTTAPTE